MIRSRAMSVDVSGTHLYLGTDSGLEIHNISQPSAPSLVHSMALPGLVGGVVVQGNYAYLATTLVGLLVVDVSTPSAPVTLGTFTFPETEDSYYSVTSLLVRNGYAYISTNETGIRIVNVAVPQVPVEVGAVPDPSSSFGAATSGQYLFVGRGDALQILDLLVPQSPTLISQVALAD